MNRWQTAACAAWGIGAVAVLGGAGIAKGAADAIAAAGLLGAGWTPVGPFLAANWIGAAGAIALCLALLGVCSALGRRIMLLIAGGWLTVPRAARPATPFLGYAVLALSIFGLAAVGLCSPGSAVACGAIAALVSVPWRRVGGIAAGWAQGSMTGIRTAPFAAAAVGLVTLAALPRLVLPEWNDDCLRYHLALPEQILLRHRLPDLPGYWAWSFPLLSDYPNVLAVACGADAAVRQTGIAFAVMGALWCVRVLAPGVPGPWALMAALAALLVPAENWFLLTGKNDSAAAGFLLASFAAAWCGVRAGRLRICAAVLAGCAVASKYTLAPLVAVGWLAATAAARGGIRGPATWGAAAVLPAAPWVIWSWIRHNDPVHPFGAAALPVVLGYSGTGFAGRVDLEGMLGRGGGAAASVFGVVAILARDGLILVAAAPAFLLARNRLAWAAVAIAAAGTTLEAAVSPGGAAQLPRFAFAAAAMMNAAAIAVLLAAWWGATPSAARRRAPVVAAAAGVLLIVLECRVNPPLKWADPELKMRGRAFLAGRIGAEGYRRELMGAYGSILEVAEARPRRPGPDRILVVGGLYRGLTRPVITDDVGWPVVWRAVHGADARRVGIRFRQLGVGAILYDGEWGSWARTVRSGYAWTDADLRAYADWAKSHFGTRVRTGEWIPGYGLQWMVEVTAGHPPAARLPVLPGIDAAFAGPTMAQMRGDFAGAAAGFRALHAIVPDVSQTGAALAEPLMRLGRTAEARELLETAERDGLIMWRPPR